MKRHKFYMQKEDPGIGDEYKPLFLDPYKKRPGFNGKDS